MLENNVYSENAVRLFITKKQRRELERIKKEDEEYDAGLWLSENQLESIWANPVDLEE